MGQEIDLLANYPRTKRNLQERNANKTAEDSAIARQFGKEFFDGDRRHGYGGFQYHPRFWQPVIPTFQQHFRLTQQSRVLDVGCAKGFMLHDMASLIPGIYIEGVDISEYAIANAVPSVKSRLKIADAKKLPYSDRS